MSARTAELCATAVNDRPRRADCGVAVLASLSATSRPSAPLPPDRARGWVEQAMQTIGYWNGAAWRVVRSPDPFRFDDVLSAVTVLSARDAWAVGTTTNGIGGDRALIVHWDGATWRVA